MMGAMKHFCCFLFSPNLAQIIMNPINRSLATALTVIGLVSLAPLFSSESQANPSPAESNSTLATKLDLPPLPPEMPVWMDNKDKNHIYRQRGVYNDGIYHVPELALDLNAVAVGHALAYEDLVTGKADGLESQTFEQIDRVLKNPPRFMPDEASISPTFGRLYGVLEQVFDWTHILHAQTFDVLASPDMTDAEKDAEIERLYQFYLTSVPYAITGLPMNMGYLDSQPYSQAFRKKYPKVNGLFWGYHWLQGSVYDLLAGKTSAEQNELYATMGNQYRQVELYRRDREFMPMFAELSPKFAARFPQLSNTFDNLHMLHDMVNDILASEGMTETEQKEQIQRAIWMVMAANHQNEEPGKDYGGDGLHDHRFVEGIPGMGLMPATVNHENHSAPASSEKVDHSEHERPSKEHSDAIKEDHSEHEHPSKEHSDAMQEDHGEHK